MRSMVKMSEMPNWILQWNVITIASSVKMRSNVFIVLLILACQVLIYYLLSNQNSITSEVSEQRLYFEVLNVQLSKLSKADYGRIFAKIFLMTETKKLDQSVLETLLSDDVKIKSPLKIHLLGKVFHFFMGILNSNIWL